ncbi:MAG: hypothetical protein K6G79_06070 [Bacteroidales bacterium]|nr:hypothetical protein [Bacteroidales bacterium]
MMKALEFGGMPAACPESDIDTGSFQPATVNLFIAGYGNVGKALVKMISDNHDAIASRTGKDLRICGLANSRRYLIDNAGIDPAALADGVAGCFPGALTDLSLARSVFVDCTASEGIGIWYPQLMKAGYAIVACNKIPFAGSMASFANLVRTAAREHVGLRYETTVGAALPILATLERAAVSGDTVVSVEAVLSGTLNYLCDRYEGRDFAALVEEARCKGYTEPDPSVDLSGRDVLRKTLIMARVAGIPLEETDVRLEPFPEDTALAAAYADAAASGRHLRYVASLRRITLPDGSARWSATVGLQAVGPDSPLYTLTGTDNCAVITSTDYPSPQEIRGAGAGPRQTAAGVLHDILAC